MVYNHSLYDGLRAIYPEHEWLPWRFKLQPAGFWESAQNRRNFLDWAMLQLKMKNLNGWYDVTLKKVRFNN
jgi:hypothetical protein